MSQDVELRCRCGEVHGIVKDASPKTVNRVVCYCDDCQAFAHYLGRPDILDVHGGSDVVQVAPAALRFDRGAARIVGMRLTPKGLFRFYTDCCKTPVGNTVTPSVPFVGIPVVAFDGGIVAADAVFGKPLHRGFVRFALGAAPDGAPGANLRMLAHALRKMFGWRLAGKAWPHPFFDQKSRTPNRRLTVLSPAERDALRPLCGPQPEPRRS